MPSRRTSGEKEDNAEARRKQRIRREEYRKPQDPTCKVGMWGTQEKSTG
jgi:hypothetical protein